MHTLMNTRKLKKLFRRPLIFFRDWLLKRYPIYNIEQPIAEHEEFLLISSDEKLKALSENTLPPFPIDVVFTWVDSSDSKWQENYRLNVNNQSDNIGLHATDQARFMNHDELYYSVYAVQNFMPWVRKIFIVTAGQTPKWLDDTHQEIHIVDHSEIIESQYLPTFNSHVIEANLHRIPGLSEHFIYFNDDVFVARPLKASHFFESNGVASLFVANKTFQNMRDRGLITPTITAAEKAISLLQTRFPNAALRSPLAHTYVPLRKSFYEKAWSWFESDIRLFLNNKVRHNGELNMATFLIPWLMYLEGSAVTRLEICYYFNIRGSFASRQYQKLLHKQKLGHQPHSFCINDAHSNHTNTNYMAQFTQFMQDYFQV